MYLMSCKDMAPLNPPTTSRSQALSNLRIAPVSGISK